MFAVTEMDGEERRRSEAQRSIMTDSNITGDLRIPERVTLKKEIGLLSACTIIIGEKSLLSCCVFFFNKTH